MYASFPDELNNFYAHFEINSPAEEVLKTQDRYPLVISRADVCRLMPPNLVSQKVWALLPLFWPMMAFDIICHLMLFFYF